MKRNKHSVRSITLAALLPASLLLTGCADGYDSPDGFDLGVRNTQMQTPPQDSISFKVSTDGTTATVSWPLVAGADGHEVTFLNVDDPANPVVVDGYEKKIVDGSKFTVTVAEDSKYQMTMRTLGNRQLGNTDDQESHVYEFSTLVPSVMTIPSGSDIAQYYKEHPLDSTGIEVAIELEPNGEYTLSDTIDFRYMHITFRGDKVHRPVVRMTGTGHFETYSTLKLKFINFDLSESTADGVVALTRDNLPDTLLSQNLGFTRNGSLINGIYHIQSPIYVAHCWFKNLPHAMLYHNKQSVAFWYFTLSDCIVQMRNDTKSNIGFINLYDGDMKGKSVKNITIENSTIYNTVDNGSACFIRYANESNSNPEKVYGTTTADLNKHIWKFNNCTFAKCYYSDVSHSGWRFINNVNNRNLNITVDHVIFYNCAQLYRMHDLSCTKAFRFNFFWNDGTDDQSRNRSGSDSSSAPFASEYDPMFGGDDMTQINKELDFTQPNGGVNFTPSEYQIVMNRGGDPRWLPDNGNSNEE